MKVWDVTPPSKLMLDIAHAEARKRAKARRLERENFERERIRRLINSFETFGAIVDDTALLFVVNKRRPENSYVIKEAL